MAQSGTVSRLGPGDKATILSMNRTHFLAPAPSRPLCALTSRRIRKHAGEFLSPFLRKFDASVAGGPPDGCCGESADERLLPSCRHASRRHLLRLRAAPLPRLVCATKNAALFDVPAYAEAAVQKRPTHAAPPLRADGRSGAAVFAGMTNGLTLLKPIEWSLIAICVARRKEELPSGVPATSLSQPAPLHHLSAFISRGSGDAVPKGAEGAGRTDSS